jgi:hypothetical protein
MIANNARFGHYKGGRRNLSRLPLHFHYKVTERRNRRGIWPPPEKYLAEDLVFVGFFKTYP